MYLSKSLRHEQTQPELIEGALNYKTQSRLFSEPYSAENTSICLLYTVIKGAIFSNKIPFYSTDLIRLFTQGCVDLVCITSFLVVVTLSVTCVVGLKTFEWLHNRKFHLKFLDPVDFFSAKVIAWGLWYIICHLLLLI